MIGLSIFVTLVILTFAITHPVTPRPHVIRLYTNNCTIDVIRVVVDGHEYLVFDKGVIHSENCKCKKGPAEEAK